MSTEEVDHLISQAPPSKRVRLDNDDAMDSSTSTPIQDSMDDFYGTEDDSTVPASAPDALPRDIHPAQISAPPPVGIPGLGRLVNAPEVPEEAAEVLIQQVVTEEPAEAISSIGSQPSTEDPNQLDAAVDNGGHEENTEMSGMTIPTATSDIPQDGTVLHTGDNKEIEVERSEIVDAQPNSASADQTCQDIEDAEQALRAIALPQVTMIERASAETNSTTMPVTHALEALLGGLDPPSPEAPVSGDAPAIDEATAEDEHPEWEVDSSPIESSSDSSSSDDSSSEEDSDEDIGYKLLSPEEQARILMEGDGGSDDEGASKGVKGSGGQLRTKNEVPEEVIPKPDVTITPEMKIEELGVVETIVDNVILIKAKTSGEYRALESGSVLCLEDRSVIGAVSETLGRVQQPLYTVRFTNAGEVSEAGLSIGTKVFYSEQYAKYALTQVLQAYKGSDASNLHDEEVGDDEIEFSDDEAEMEHKRRLKQKKLEKRGGKMQQNGGSSRGGYSHGHPLQQQHSPGTGTGLSYDDAEDDGPYKPLSRPTGFADTVGRSEAPQEEAYNPGMSDFSGRGDHNRDQFRGRGRGDRGRGRGQGRGSFQNRRENNGYSLPPQVYPNGNQAPQHQSPLSHSHPPPYGSSQSGIPPVPLPFPPLTANNFYRPPHDQYSPQQPQMWPQQYPQPPFQPPYQQGYQNMQNGWPQPPPLPSGAFINPAFFQGHQPTAPNQWNQQGHQGVRGGRGGGSS